MSSRRRRARPASERAKTSSPANSTRPLVGRSSVPSTCSSVDFPTPDAPMTATLSPGSTVSVTPRRTRTISGPILYSRSSSSATSRCSLIAENLDRIELRGAPRRREGCEERDDERGADDQAEVRSGELHRQVADLIDVAGEPDDPIRVLDPDEQQAERAAGHGTDQPDQHPGDEEDRGDRGRARSHRFQDTDLFPFL